MALIPLMIDLDEKKVVIAGGGSIAERRAKTLLKSGASITVISPEIKKGIRALWEEDLLIWKEKNVQTSDLADAFLIIVATSDPIVNQEVIQKAPSSALINAAAEADKGNVAFPSTFRRGKLNISISTNGASPQLAVKIRRQLESLYDEKYEDYVDFLYECRKLVKLTSLDKLHQRLLLKELLSEGFLDKHQQLMAITWLKKLARGGEGND